MVKNTAIQGSSYAKSFGGINFGALYYMTPWLAAGLGYRSDFDFLGGPAPTTKGFEITGRLYPFDQGTYTIKTWDENAVEFQPSGATYFLSEFSQKSFVLKTKDVRGYNEEGEMATINLGLGIERRISRHFEFNLEAIYTAYLVSTSDPTKKFRSLFTNIGFNFVW